MGEPLWYLRHPKIIDIATDLNATTKIVAEVLRRLGIADDVERQGRVFYDACVINRYRFRDMPLFAGRQNAGFKLFAEYTDIGMNPWLA
ncbi:hypothetical protein AAVH_31919 [Aphelenchoides avenae]|nr:hypothetical protein AAVH_31919 [Aphelenchus avenae]